MQKIFLFLLSLMVSVLSVAQDVEFASNELIVKFKTTSVPNAEASISDQIFEFGKLDQLNEQYGMQTLQLTGNKRNEDTYLIRFESDQDILSLVETYKSLGIFDYVEPNYIGYGHGHGVLTTTPNDENYSNQWGHNNDGTFAKSTAKKDADIDTDEAWDYTTGDSNIIVAIMDSGVKLDHPEFAKRVWQNADETENGKDSDANKYIDDVKGGWDFAYQDNDPSDDHGHGTNVAGIALASGDNGIGYAGVNWKSKMMVCKILNANNFGYYSWWAEAIYYAVDNGASVINMSVGGNTASTMLKEAIDYAYAQNVCVVVSAGNQNSVIQYPARYENAFAIGSTSSDDTRTVPFFWDAKSGSNYGPELDFIAPGNYIYGLSHQSNTNYNTYWGGTSQGAPHVAGVISLLYSQNPTITVDMVREILEATSEDQVGDTAEDKLGWDQYYGHGRINAFQALTYQIVSAKNLEAGKMTILHPNPIEGGNIVRLSNLKNGHYTVHVIDGFGREIHVNKLIVHNAESMEIELPDLAFGHYSLLITDECNRSFSKRLVVKK